MVTSPILYAGKHIKEVLAPAVYGGNTYTAGLWKLVETMKSKAVYTQLDFADTLSAGNFCGSGAATGSTLAEISIELVQLKADFTVCKDNFRGTYLEDNYTPALEAYINTALGAYSNLLENIRWSGDTALAIAPLNTQNGVVKQLVTGASFIPVAGALAANILDPTKVIAELNKALAVVPAEVLYSPDFKIVMAPQVFSAYRQAAWADGNFNAGLTQIQSFATINDPSRGPVGTFYNYPVYIATGLNAVTTAPSTRANAHVVLMGSFNGERSNLILATDMISDSASINVIDLYPANGNDSFRIQYMFKQGIGVANQDQIVMYR